MNNELDNIIKNSHFKIEEGEFVYAKVSEITDIEKHFLVAKDTKEITVVTEEKNISNLNILERNKEIYSLIRLDVSTPFYAVGFLATVSKAMADKSMNILIISTFSRDYIMVVYQRVGEAREVLQNLGFKEVFS